MVEVVISGTDTVFVLVSLVASTFPITIAKTINHKASAEQRPARRVSEPSPLQPLLTPLVPLLPGTFDEALILRFDLVRPRSAQVGLRELCESIICFITLILWIGDPKDIVEFSCSGFLLCYHSLLHHDL
jgi:hypothetical protein